MKYKLCIISIIICLASCTTKNKIKEHNVHSTTKSVSNLIKTNLVIIGGGKTIKDAEKLKEKYFTNQNFNSNIKGTPIISLSDTISGLNSGFYIVTIGCVSNEENVKSVVKKANSFYTGVYYRKVKLNSNQYKTLASKITIKPKCIYKNLSKGYNFEIDVTKESSSTDSLIIEITPINKQNNERLNTIYAHAFQYSSTFINCGDYVGSYTTNVNAKFFDNADNGDFVVADFNFDSQDDFAIKIAPGGSVGAPKYNFYLQTNGQFIKDDFLSSIGIFPKEINKHKKQLTINYLHDRCTMLEKKYQYNSAKNTWNELRESKKLLCDEK